MRPRHAVEAVLANAALGALGGLSWPGALRVGAGLGEAARRLGVRRRVARANLALAFPDLDGATREAILAAHYREIGRIAAEYGRMPRLARAPDEEVIAGVEGLDALLALKGRGVFLLSGHYGNFELMAARLGRENPVDFLVRPQSNAAVDERVNRLRRESGVGVISTSGGVKQVIRALRAGHWIAIVGDQDARRQGVFVPFFGRLASTPQGPARLSLQLDVPIVFGTPRREPDGRHRLILEPPRWPDGPADDDRVRALTAWHAALLERRIREAPEHWFWLHRRWKTPPPASMGAEGGSDASL